MVVVFEEFPFVGGKFEGFVWIVDGIKCLIFGDAAFFEAFFEVVGPDDTTGHLDLKVGILGRNCRRTSSGSSGGRRSEGWSSGSGRSGNTAGGHIKIGLSSYDFIVRGRS